MIFLKWFFEWNNNSYYTIFVYKIFIEKTV